MGALQANLRGACGDEMESLMGTMAEALIERGKAEGLTRIMERRFGPLSQTVRDRITVAGPEELDAWLDRVLDADNLEAMFGGTDQH